MPGGEKEDRKEEEGRELITLFSRFHVDLRPYPIILRIDRELEGHPAFRAAHPSNQPDCPPEAAK